MTSIFFGPSPFAHKDAFRVVIIYGTVTASANSFEVHDLSFNWSFVLSHLNTLIILMFMFWFRCRCLCS